MSELAIVFELGKTPCALPASSLREILETAHVSPAPMAPASIEGVLNRLGRLYVVFDLGSLIGIGLEQRSKLLLFGHEKYAFAAWVDNVVGVANVELDQMYAEYTLPFQMAALEHRGRIVPLLDPELIFRRIDELV